VSKSNLTNDDAWSRHDAWVEIARLRDENARLRAEVDELRAQLDQMRAERNAFALAARHPKDADD
jgi:cell division protein FtsB